MSDPNYAIQFNENPVVNLITGQTDKRQKRWELVREDGEVIITAKDKEFIEEYAKMSGLEVEI